MTPFEARPRIQARAAPSAKHGQITRSAASGPDRGAATGIELRSAQTFRRAIGHFATGVTVVTAVAEEGDVGMTASAVSSLCLEPPMLLLCVNRAARCHDVICASGRFVLHVLGDDQTALAVRFATPMAEKFDDLPVLRNQDGIRIIPGTLARFDCAVVEQLGGGTHSIFVAAVEFDYVGTGQPLVYVRGRFGRFLDDVDGVGGASAPPTWDVAMAASHLGW